MRGLWIFCFSNLFSLFFRPFSPLHVLAPSSSLSFFKRWIDRPTNQPTHQPTNPPTKTEKPKTKSLLFHRIKPVFVFDGATPLLKQSTLARRRARRERADVQVRQAAERILLAQLRRRALVQVAAEGSIPRASRPSSQRG